MKEARYLVENEGRNLQYLVLKHVFKDMKTSNIQTLTLVQIKNLILRTQISPDGSN